MPAHGSRFRRRDEISVVEAAYDWAEDDREWLARLLEAIQPLTDGGFGVYAWTFDLQKETRSIQNIVGRDTPDGLLDAVVEVHEKASEFAMRVGYSPTAFTISEKFGGDFATVDILAPIVERFGVRDSLGLLSVDPSGLALIIGSALPKSLTCSPALRRRCSRLVAHLTSAYRLRAKLAVRRGGPMANAQAVLSPSGNVEHAEGAARSQSARTALREAVVCQERARGPLSSKDPDAALELWQGLVDGRWSLTDHFESDGRRYLVAIENAPEVAEVRRLTAQERRVLAFAALGYSAKLIGYQLGIPVGTVSACLVSAREKAGFRTRQQLASWFAGVLSNKPEEDSPMGGSLE